MYNNFPYFKCPYQQSMMRQMPGLPFGTPQPSGPPPGKTPKKLYSALKVDPAGIAPCRLQFTYIWLKDKKGSTGPKEFWTYIIYVGPTSVAGFRWTGSRWLFWGTDLNNIDTFTCY
ncbi:hypothetical protein [Anaerosolibacter sp.]|uniref:hypothetical protein n=1 Tax=Anaerosolibacter sp. TaxID=1872527 RepID=UPI0039EFC2E3